MSETLHERQEIFWEAYWGEMSGALPREILYSRFTQEAYQCLKNLLGAPLKQIGPASLGLGGDTTDFSKGCRWLTSRQFTLLVMFFSK